MARRPSGVHAVRRTAPVRSERSPVNGSSTVDLVLPGDHGSWTALDRRLVDTVRVLAADAVERVGNGHPGTAMSLAPVATLLFQRVLRHDPSDPSWAGRDRFVLSCGHSSLTLYLQLFFSGYGLTLEDLKEFRTWGSATPGHPEFGHTPGVETTTGPLGQGIANAVGMAMAARRTAGWFDPDASAGPFDHRVFVLASDGDLQEGVSAEASSLAGHQRLGNLVVIYDANRISIEGDTDLAFSEDVALRYEAYGWHVEQVGLAPDGDVDLLALAHAIHRADQDERPSLIVLRTIIAWPAPSKQGTAASHGARLGADEVAATKAVLGFDPDRSFVVEPEVLDHARTQVAARAAERRTAWQHAYDAWRAADPDRAREWDRVAAGRLPEGWADALPDFSGASAMATRKASGAVLAALAPVVPELWGGSADLGESNNTDLPGASSFLPAGHRTGSPAGRQLHFGVREHAMGSVMNGIALSGAGRIYGGTFLVFSDYMRPAVRMAALMSLPVVYVWTHDSIGLGEDGPTHQPVEHLTALRAIPGLDVVRPADATETSAAWAEVLRRHGRPAGLVLTRQDVPVLPAGAADGTAKGGYVLRESSFGAPEVVLIGTGSEVHVALAAAELLEGEGLATRVVSMPCIEWFREQSAQYQESVLAATGTVRVSVEAGITWPWREFVGDRGATIGLDRFGASAAGSRLFEEFGITPAAVAEAARDALGR
jgi:transketolase